MCLLQSSDQSVRFILSSTKNTKDPVVLTYMALKSILIVLLINQVAHIRRMTLATDCVNDLSFQSQHRVREGRNGLPF